MPRVSTATKSARGKDVSCDKCREPIKVGQAYFYWKFRYSHKRTRHVLCGRPKPSELTQSKMSGVYAAIEAAEAAIAAAGDASDIAEALRTAASGVEDVRQEYQDGLDNMPDGLRESAENGETGERISALEDFNQSLDSAADEIDSEDKPTEADGDEDLEDTKRNWLEGLRDRASDALAELSI